MIGPVPVTRPHEKATLPAGTEAPAAGLLGDGVAGAVHEPPPTLSV